MIVNLALLACLPLGMGGFVVLALSVDHRRGRVIEAANDWRRDNPGVAWPAPAPVAPVAAPVPVAVAAPQIVEDVA